MVNTPPTSRVPPEWMPWLITAATCIIATTLAIRLYRSDQSHSRKSRLASKARRPRHLDIDVDLTNPLLLGGAIPNNSNSSASGGNTANSHSHGHGHGSSSQHGSGVGASGLDPTAMSMTGSNGALPGMNNPSTTGSNASSLGHRLSNEFERPGNVGGGLTVSGGSGVRDPILSPVNEAAMGHWGGNGGGSGNASVVAGLDPNLVRSIVEKLLDVAPVEPPVNAFVQAIAGTSGKPAFRPRRGIAIREFTDLPPFLKQINHIIYELKTAKKKNKPLLMEGPPGLGKGTALQQWIADEGQVRPAIYLQLSMVLRKRHGASSVEDEDMEDDFFTETETETEGLEERVMLTVRRDAWKKAVETALGVGDDEISMAPLIGDDENDDVPQVDMTLLNHVAQALRLIAAGSKAGPTLLVIDDVQLLFRERTPLTEKYDGIPEVFAWLLRCELEGILDVVFCSSEKSAVGAIKR
ncbi:hypothetical protein HDU76_006139, partial [Blyttiomyces sp. JEL0837]